MTPKPTFGDVSACFLNSQPEPKKRGPTIILPKRYCANKACGKEIAVNAKYATCCYHCYLVVKAEQDAIEAADKLPVDEPF